MKQLEPIESSKRIASLDVIRGFSLLGIFIVNMMAFHSPMYYYDPYTWWGDSLNRPVYWWIDVFVQASFYPIFTMMFGYGLAIQYRRSIEKESNFFPFAIKRLLILLVIGVIHAFVIWSGDILISYAVVGLLFIWLLKLDGKWLLTLGLVLFLLPQLLISGVFILANFVDPTSVTYFSAVQEIQSSIEAFGSGSIGDIFVQRYSDWMYANSPAAFVTLVIALLPLMMIGAGISKINLLERASEKKKSLIIITLITLPLALALKTAPYWGEKNLAFSFIQDFVGGPLLSMAYIALLALLMTSAKSVKLLRPLAQTGRMSLTNYLMQSIIGTLIFYNYGLGLYDEVKLSTSILLALAIFVIQMIVSEIWLAKFRRGPFESLWRRLSYGKNVK